MYWLLVLLVAATVAGCHGKDQEEQSRRERTLTEPITRKSDEYVYSTSPPQYRPNHQPYPWQ